MPTLEASTCSLSSSEPDVSIAYHQAIPRCVRARSHVAALGLTLIAWHGALDVLAGQTAAAPVALASLRVRGPLPRATVQEAMEGALQTYGQCVHARAAERGRVAGELHLRVHIEANGVPIAASVDWSNVGDRPLERCVTAATEAWRLPERDAATLVSFTMRVGHGAPTGTDRDVGAVIASSERDDGHLPAEARNTSSNGERQRVVRRTWTPVDGGLRVTGALTEARVARVLRTKTAALRRCVSVPPAGGGTPAPWEGLLSLRIGGDGRLSEEPVVQLPGAPPSVVACVAGVLRDTRFPAASGETQVLSRHRAAPHS